jgi:hypothetical protein
LEEHVALQLGEQIIEEWNPFSYLIKDKNDEELTFLGRPIKYFPKYTKEEIDQILSTSFPQPSTSERDEPEIQVFNNILAIEGFLESQKTHSHPSSPPKVHTPPSPHTSQPSSPPKSPTPVVHTMVVNRMDAIIAARYAPLVLPQGFICLPNWRLHEISA